jgi:thiamine kinase-like enzyme
VDQYCHWFTPDGLNHTDVAIDNFIKTSQGLRLIDWEKPRLDDCTYDVCCFLCEPAQLWCTHQPLSQSGRELFLNAYILLSGREEAKFLKKIHIRESIVSLHWVLWGANKLCDLRDGRTAMDLQEVHRTKVERWERLARPQNVAKLFQIFSKK